MKARHSSCPRVSAFMFRPVKLYIFNFVKKWSFLLCKNKFYVMSFKSFSSASMERVFLALRYMIVKKLLVPGS